MHPSTVAGSQDLRAACRGDEYRHKVDTLDSRALLQEGGVVCNGGQVEEILSTTEELIIIIKLFDNKCYRQEICFWVLVFDHREGTVRQYKCHWSQRQSFINGYIYALSAGTGNARIVMLTSRFSYSIRKMLRYQELFDFLIRKDAAKTFFSIFFFL